MNNAEIRDEREILSEMAQTEADQGVLDDASESVAANDEPEARTTPYEITSYGADFPVESLIARLSRSDIFMPDFQRKFVWSQSDASRFIESLLLGFPVPAIFLYREAKNKHLVVDGQQRLVSLQRYYNGFFGDRRFKLTGIGSAFSGRGYSDLDEEDRRKLNDALIHAIIVQQVEPAEDNVPIHSSIYLLFERLNSWGRPLFPQEIRACVDHGAFIELLKELNKLEQWRKLYGPDSKRSKDQELILRFLALYFGDIAYEQPMKSYLDRFCSYNRHLERHSAAKCRAVFTQMIGFVTATFGPGAFKPIKAFNAALFDAISVGLARRLARGQINDSFAAQGAYQQLLKDGAFIAAYSSSTSRADQVELRLRLAADAFARID